MVDVEDAVAIQENRRPPSHGKKLAPALRQRFRQPDVEEIALALGAGETAFARQYRKDVGLD